MWSIIMWLSVKFWHGLLVKKKGKRLISQLRIEANMVFLISMLWISVTWIWKLLMLNYKNFHMYPFLSFPNCYHVLGLLLEYLIFCLASFHIFYTGDEPQASNSFPCFSLMCCILLSPSFPLDHWSPLFPFPFPQNKFLWCQFMTNVYILCDVYEIVTYNYCRLLKTFVFLAGKRDHICFVSGSIWCLFVHWILDLFPYFPCHKMFQSFPLKVCEL